MLKVLAAEDSVDSSHFVMRTARTQGIGQGGKEAGLLTWPNQKPTKIELGRPWP